MTDPYNPETARERMAAALEPFLHDMLTGAARKEAVDAALAALSRPPADHADLIAWIESVTTDWDGSRMVDGEPPRIVPSCGELRQIAAALAQPVPQAVEELCTKVDAWMRSRERAGRVSFAGMEPIRQMIDEFRTLSRANTRLTEGVAAVRENCPGDASYLKGWVEACDEILKHLGQQAERGSE